MPQAESAELRIYCICGQKMRIQAAMFGRPGKCIACRQKIRIPRSDEIPSDSPEIHLKDHPEFLRNPKAAAQSTEEIPADDPEDLSLGEAETGEETIPFQVFEHLRLLCNLDNKILRRLKPLKSVGAGSPEAVEKADLMRYRTLVRGARTKLDEKMRHRLRMVSSRLMDVEEELGRAAVGARAGEMDFEVYWKFCSPMRHEREALILETYNLKGWLATCDPCLAGGHADIELADVPLEDVALPTVKIPHQDQALISSLVLGLRQAFQSREQAEGRSQECHRLVKAGTLVGPALDAFKEETDACKRMAQAAIVFYRGRLEHLLQDCEIDTKAVKAQLRTLRNRLEQRVLDRGAYQSAEIRLLRVQSDLKKVEDLALRAAHANSLSDVPDVQGTFLRRITRQDADSGLGADSWLAWGASALMFVAVFVPFAGAQGGANTVVMRGMVVGLLLTSVVYAMLAVIPRRGLRAAAMTVLWAFSTVAGAFFLNQAWYGLGSAGLAMRASPQWFLSPGILLLGAAALAMAVSALVSMVSAGLSRSPWMGVFLLAPLAVAGALTDFAGLVSAAPWIEEAELRGDSQGEEGYNVTVHLRNEGWRPFWIAGTYPTVPTPYTYVVERRIGPDSWENVSMPLTIRLENSPWWQPADERDYPPIGAGSRFSLRYDLPPATYRVALLPFQGGGAQLSRLFTITGPAETTVEEWPEEAAPASPALPQGTDFTEPVSPGVVEGAASPAASPETGEEARPESTPALGVRSVGFELSGIINGASRSPRFYVSVHSPEGRVTRRYLSLGDTIAGPWQAFEFSPDKQTLTISNGSSFQVVQPGESLRLELPE